MSACDGRWEVDLLCRYLVETKTPAVRTGGWFNEMDPGGILNDRKSVYDMLVGRGPHASHTNPSDDAAVFESMIPWNQQNLKLRKTFKEKMNLPAKTPLSKVEVCGSALMLMFRKYMGCGPDDPPFKRDVSARWDAAGWIVKSLRAWKPVRAHLPERDHYVGIVGFRGWSVAPGVSRTSGSTQRYEFLCADPWAGGPENATHELSYGGGITCFLWTIRQEGKELMFDHYRIGTVEGYVPIP
ncbi:MAG TPA: hypothetical protein VF179_14400 [Thermoanaerobaculia bacterium]|nr:hypothetical protein [Thermoanaerobaculia bacterium]